MDYYLINKNLSLKAKGLLDLIRFLNEQQIKITVEIIASLTKDSYTSIRSGLKELEANNYLVISRKKSDQGYFYFDYEVKEVIE